MKTELQQANLLYLRDLIAGKPEEQVILYDYRSDCGSAFCIGGWVAIDPHFQKQGVYPSGQSGAPRPDQGGGGAVVVGEKLFGEPNLFASRTDTEYDSSFDYMPHKQRALARIDRAIAGEPV